MSFIRTFIPGPKKLRRKLLGVKNEFLKLYYPKGYADYLYKNAFGYGIDWDHPRDLNEWINYLAFKTNTLEWSYLSDKFLVREYVASKNLSNILIPLYGVWKSVEDVDFNSLPNSFVIKTNHMSGDSIIIYDKDSEDIEMVKTRLRVSMHSRFGVDTAEPHYLKIKPLVLAERLLPPPTNIDYKIWCFHGVPNCIMTISNRNVDLGTFNLNVYDLEWQKHAEWLTPRYQNDVEVPRPRKLDEMINYAQVLSKGFPQVRIDFYNTDEGVFFGEMTFTSYCGRMDYFTKEHLVAMGNKIKVKCQ